ALAPDDPFIAELYEQAPADRASGRMLGKVALKKGTRFEERSRPRKPKIARSQTAAQGAELLTPNPDEPSSQPGIVTPHPDDASSRPGTATPPPDDRGSRPGSASSSGGMAAVKTPSSDESLARRLASGRGPTVLPRPTAPRRGGTSTFSRWGGWPRIVMGIAG